MNDRLFFIIACVLSLVWSGIGYWLDKKAKNASLDREIWRGDLVKWIGILFAIFLALMAYFSPISANAPAPDATESVHMQARARINITHASFQLQDSCQSDCADEPVESILNIASVLSLLFWLAVAVVSAIYWRKPKE